MQDIFREMGATYSLLYPEQSGIRTPSSTSVLVARAVVYLQTHYQNPTLTLSLYTHLTLPTTERV